ENGKAGEDQPPLVRHRHMGVIWFKLAPRDTKGAEALRAQLLEDTSGASSSRIVERQERRRAGLLVPVGSPENVLWRTLGDQHAMAFARDQHRHAASQKIERHLVDLG